MTTLKRVERDGEGKKKEKWRIASFLITAQLFSLTTGGG